MTPRLWLASLLVSAVVAVTACSQGGTAAAPTSAAAATVGAVGAATAVSNAAPATSAPTTSVAPTSGAYAAGPTAAAAPTAGAAAPPTSGVAPATAAASTAAPAASGGAVVLQIAGEGNEARYKVQEQLAGRDLPSEAVGRTSGVTGTIALDAGGAVDAAGSKISVDLSQLQSDQSRRDNFIRRNTLETETFPNAEFIPREAPGLPSPLPTSGEHAFQLVGDLTVHGVTKPATWDVTAQFGDDGITGSAVTRLKFSDFGMEPPKVGPVLSIEDDISLEIDFRALRQS